MNKNNQFIIESCNKLSEISLLKDITTANIIMLDDRVSESTSLEVISHLRLNNKILSPIFYFSNPEYDNGENAMNRGVNFCFKKPINKDELISAIDKVIIDSQSKEMTT